MRFTDRCHLSQVDSTNFHARKLALKGAPEGNFVTADEQTAGRGRLDRTWESPKGNLYLSLILRPSIPVKCAPQLTFVAALAAYDLMTQQFNVKCQLKWPNDLLVRNKKMVGILTELETKENEIDFIIQGIGMNVNQKEFTRDLTSVAISLSQVLNRQLNLDDVLRDYLEHYENRYAAYLKNGFAGLKEDWEIKSHISGQKLTIHDGEKKISGIGKGITEEGALLLETPTGEVLTFFSGDVSCS